VARIRSVLVGVDVYERPDVPNLGGCVNDVALVRRILKQYFGVPNEDLRVVVNERATKANILHRLTHAVREAEPGDIVVFYFSGHGSQIRDRDGDELNDLLDEIICPHDMDWATETYILDDELDLLFSQIPHGVLLEVFLDCCFWGAGPPELEAELRPQALRSDVRFLAPPLDIAARAEGDERQLGLHGFAQCECFSDHVLWAASAEGQPAAEDYLDGRAHGVFTYWGCRFIEANADQILHRGYSREHLLLDLRAYLSSLGYQQAAQLAARDELLELGPLTFERLRHRVQPGTRPRGPGNGHPHGRTSGR
jgi:hypothetical protein